MEQDAVKELLDSEDEGYQYFMRNEPHVKSDRFIDEETGRAAQMWDVGMLRNTPANRRKTMKVFLEPMPHVVLDQNVALRGWYKGKFEPPNVRPRPCFTEAILTQPYGGFCHVGCAFCYINHGFRGYRGQGITTVDPVYPAKVAKQLRGMRTGAAGYLSSFTDPFVKLEEIYHNTQRTAEAFVNEGLPVFFLSRLTYPGWAYDLLLRNSYSYAQMSINTSDPDDWKRLSPKAIPLPDMLDQVQSIHEAGIYVSIQVNPIMPGVTTNEEIVELIHTLAERGADHLIFKFVEISYSSRKALVEIVNKRWGDNRGGVFRDLFTCNIGGEATIDEEYRLSALRLFGDECRKAGVTMATCYEYKYKRDADGAIINKTGISVGAEFLTADQCHGHRVPMFTRDEPGAPFTEIAECPPQGCLTCGDTGPVPCGSELLGKAPALRAKDLRLPARIIGS